MGIAATAASPPHEAAAPADPPAKQDIPLPTAASAAIPEATDPPAKEETQPTAAAAVATADAPGGGAEEAGETVVLDANAESSAEEEGECGFCLFMKGGGCKEEFVAWEKCVEEAEVEGADVVERCYEVTAALRRCMDEHPDYYEPILRAERAMAEDLEAAKASEASSQDSPPAAAEGEQGDQKQAEEKEKEDLAA